MRARLTLLVVGLFLGASCADPAHEQAVDALGPEAPGVSPGPLHRPGQACTTCHGGSGPGEPDFVIAGTVFTVRGSTTPLEGALVTVTDATGAVRNLGSNAAGNFYMPKSSWAPTYPLHVQVSLGAETQEMLTRIGRDGGCGSCHRGAGNAERMPGVYLRNK